MPFPSHYGTLPGMPIELTAARLRHLLEELDITNEEAARLCGVYRSSVQRWLSGDVPIPASVIRMLEYQRFIERGQRLIKVLWAEPPEEKG